jgi:hypothetical protein
MHSNQQYNIIKQQQESRVVNHNKRIVETLEQGWRMKLETNRREREREENDRVDMTRWVHKTSTPHHQYNNSGNNLPTTSNQLTINHNQTTLIQQR